MSLTEKRRHLDDYHRASRDMELAQVCIDILEQMQDKARTKCIKELKAAQQRQLRELDAAAERLGAPYPG